jgi:hypothetical protein
MLSAHCTLSSNALHGLLGVQVRYDLILPQVLCLDDMAVLYVEKADDAATYDYYCTMYNDHFEQLPRSKEKAVSKIPSELSVVSFFSRSRRNLH